MDAINTAPSREDYEYTVPGQNWVNGVRQIFSLTPDVMSRYPEFPVHEDDVFICAYPKVGSILTTTIVSAILHQNDLDTWKKSPPALVPRFMDLSFEFSAQIPRPSYFLNHMPYHLLPVGVRQKNAKIVHISRDPKDVAVSYYYFHKHLSVFGPWNGPWDVFYDNFIGGQVPWGSYFSLVRSYWEQKNNPNVMNIRYEQLKRDPKTWISKLAEFLGKPLDPEKLEKIVELTSFRNMKANPALNPDAFGQAMEKFRIKAFGPTGTFLRKGDVGDWHHLFTEEQRRQTDGLYIQLCKDTGMEVIAGETIPSNTDC